MKCPICGKPIAWKDNPFRPFCSERCQLVDLGRWVNGEYSVPGEQVTVPDAPDAPERSARED
jgi:endogenous inhibitor of DNA gyrase (YacG/DUF329 family)